MKRVKERLDALESSDVEDRLNKLRLLIFDRKIHNAVKRLSGVIRKHIDADLKGKIQERSASGGDDDGKDAVGEFVEKLVVAKLVKICHSKVVASERQRQHAGNKDKQDGDKDHRRLIPAWYEGCDFNVIFNDKSNEKNPSYVWKEVILKVDGAEKFSSKMWNNGKVKELLHSFEDGMDVFLCINRDEKLKQRKEKLANEPQGEVESSGSDGETEGPPEDRRLLGTTDDGVDFDENSLEQYDDMLVASSSESESESESETGANEENFENPEQGASGIDESAESDNDGDDDDDTGASTVKKYNLPELMAGYYSGDDDDDQATSEWDKTAMEQISNQEEKRKKKNRRGQRARRKIWEQKYGKRANHIQKELKEKEAKRLKRQREYEERASRRAAKQAKFDQTNVPVAPHDEQSSSKPQTDKAEHPSWVAKRLAAERLKTTKFQGKKITFD